MSRNLKIAQIFSINDQYLPTKASLLLRPSITKSLNYFDLSSENIIDAINFSSISSNNEVPIMVDDSEVSTYSGSGYWRNAVELVPGVGGSSSEYNFVRYPVRAQNSNANYVHVRVYSDSITNLEYDLGIDDDFSSGITGSESVSAGWNWILLDSFQLWDTETHDLCLRFKNNNNIYVDQIGLNLDSSPSSSNSLSVTSSPYITVHVNMYDVSDDKPSTSKYIYDYKTTIENIKSEGWFNFDMNFIHINGVSSFDDYQAIVLRTAGSGKSNFISWQIFEEEDAYSNNPSSYWSV